MKSMCMAGAMVACVATSAFGSEQLDLSPWWFSASGVSLHLCRECGIRHATASGAVVYSPYNAFNAGVGVEYHGLALPDLVGMAGYYRNSRYKPSLYVQIGWTPVHLGLWVSAGATAGVLTGYRQLQRYGDVAVGGLVRIESGRLGGNVIVMPGYGETPWVLALQIKARF